MARVRYVDLTFCQKHGDYVVNKSYVAHNSKIYITIIPHSSFLDSPLNIFAYFLKLEKSRIEFFHLAIFNKWTKLLSVIIDTTLISFLFLEIGRKGKNKFVKLVFENSQMLLWSHELLDLYMN